MSVPLGPHANHEHLLWYICFKDVEIGLQGKNWVLFFNTPCEHLHPTEHLCQIYEERPGVCKRYQPVACEFDLPRKERFDKWFTTYDELQTFLNK